MKFKRIANQCSVQSFQTQKIVLSHQKFNTVSHPGIMVKKLWSMSFIKILEHEFPKNFGV
jgi:hypothetical protein